MTVEELLRAWREDIDSAPFPDFAELGARPDPSSGR